MSTPSIPESSVAVVKPDHIGDFVLAVPALRALAAVVPGFDLLAPTSNRFVFDRFMLGRATFKPAMFAHLTRGKGGLDTDDAFAVLRRYGFVVILRNDEVMSELADRLGGSCRIVDDSRLLHETEQHRVAIADLTGWYSRTAQVWPESPPVWPSKIGTVGISLSAGFTSNKLPLAQWIDVANSLRAHGLAIRIIGGPQELAEIDIACRQLAGVDARPIIGSADLGRFADDLAECDVVVGADSGSMHLISNTRPVVGLFTSSPWQRFAPLGPHVRVVFADIPCSPCLQYSPHAYNACTTRECAGLITTDDVVRAVLTPPFDGIRQLSETTSLVTAPAHVIPRHDARLALISTD